VSHQDKFDPQISADDVSKPLEDRLPLEVRLGLEEVAAATEEELRREAPKEPTDRQLWALACRIYDARRNRDRIFNQRLFGEPAWDMLLALYCLPRQGIFLGVTSLAHAANVPPSTGHRWQKILFDEGLIERGPAVLDHRQHLVGLTDKGKTLMRKYLTRLFHCEGPSKANTD